LIENLIASKHSFDSDERLMEPFELINELIEVGVVPKIIKIDSQVPMRHLDHHPLDQVMRNKIKLRLLPTL
jgi:hypothetical protein